MSGLWVFVCGPSGAGKDSVIDWAWQALCKRTDIVFARRIITRPAQVGSDHDAVTPAQFDALRARQGLAWHWAAHGFCYGVPSRYAQQVAWDRVVVVNGSREHADALPLQAGIYRVLVTATPAQLAQRLQSRGRDAPEAVAQRLARNARLEGNPADMVICNDGALKAAGTALQQRLEALARSAPARRAAAGD